MEERTKHLVAAAGTIAAIVGVAASGVFNPELRRALGLSDPLPPSVNQPEIHSPQTHTARSPQTSVAAEVPAPSVSQPVPPRKPTTETALKRELAESPRTPSRSGDPLEFAASDSPHGSPVPPGSDSRPHDAASAPLGSPVPSSGLASQNKAPAFQDGRIRATVGQLAVTPNNRRAVLNVMIENVSTEALHLALDGYGNAKVALSDDRATVWSIRGVNGLQIIYTYGSQIFKEDNFTFIPPAARINLIMTFEQAFPNVDKTGSTFSFSAEALYYAPPGVNRASIGMFGISPNETSR